MSETTTITELWARAELARAGYRPDPGRPGKYWGWSEKWGDYGYQTALELLAQIMPTRCLDCGRPTRNPARCIDCANDAEAGDVPH
jgi:hypothetical protein